MNDPIKLGKKLIGKGQKCYIIAEMSANHAGNYERAVEIIGAAKDAGADCIKIQTYTPDTITINCDNDYFHIAKGTWKGENLYQLYGKAFTPWEWQADLKREAEKNGLAFLSTAFDFSSVDFLEKINLDFYKIASFELVDIPLIKYIASKHKPIILSTGMASLGEIDEAVAAVKSENNFDLCLLKCSSAYPAIPKDMNIKTMPALKELFGTPVGLSDHTLTATSAITAVSLGASIIEKHFCISRKIENPDSTFSMEPKEFSEMVRLIREVEDALGGISFTLSEKELQNKNFRKSIFVVKDINEGEIFTSENIRIIRPSYGLKPKYYDNIIGKKATKKISFGTPLKWEHVEN